MILKRHVPNGDCGTTKTIIQGYSYLSMYPQSFVVFVYYRGVLDRESECVLFLSGFSLFVLFKQKVAPEHSVPLICSWTMRLALQLCFFSIPVFNSCKKKKKRPDVFNNNLKNKKKCALMKQVPPVAPQLNQKSNVTPTVPPRVRRCRRIDAGTNHRKHYVKEILGGSLHSFSVVIQSACVRDCFTWIIKIIKGLH